MYKNAYCDTVLTLEIHVIQTTKTYQIIITWSKSDTYKKTSN